MPQYVLMTKCYKKITRNDPSFVDYRNKKKKPQIENPHFKMPGQTNKGWTEIY